MLQEFALEGELASVEARLREATASDEPLLSEMARHVIDAGGKRVRPLSALLTYRAVGGTDERLDEVVDIAVGLELIHSATLIHDDINDGARTRRGRPAVHAKYGQAHAIIAGDFLFTKGFQISGRFDREVVDWTAEACRQLAEGEILQSRHLNDPTRTIDDCLMLIQRKTASFIQTGTRIGAHLGGASPEVVEATGKFGLDLGIAFQIVDDVLDIVGDRGATGKRPGIDIADGNPTLPVLLALGSDHPDADRLASIIANQERSDGDVSEACRIVGEAGGVAHARRMAHEYGTRARQHLEVIDNEVGRARLETLVDLVLARDG